MFLLRKFRKSSEERKPKSTDGGFDVFGNPVKKLGSPLKSPAKLPGRSPTITSSGKSPSTTKASPTKTLEVEKSGNPSTTKASPTKTGNSPAKSPVKIPTKSLNHDWSSSNDKKLFSNFSTSNAVRVTRGSRSPTKSPTKYETIPETKYYLSSSIASSQGGYYAYDDYYYGKSSAKGSTIEGATNGNRSGKTTGSKSKSSKGKKAGKSPTAPTQSYVQACTNEWVGQRSGKEWAKQSTTEWAGHSTTEWAGQSDVALETTAEVHLKAPDEIELKVEQVVGKTKRSKAGLASERSEWSPINTECEALADDFDAWVQQNQKDQQGIPTSRNVNIKSASFSKASRASKTPTDKTSKPSKTSKTSKTSSGPSSSSSSSHREGEVSKKKQEMTENDKKNAVDAEDAKLATKTDMTVKTRIVTDTQDEEGTLIKTLDSAVPNTSTESAVQSGIQAFFPNAARFGQDKVDAAIKALEGFNFRALKQDSFGSVRLTTDDDASNNPSTEIDGCGANAYEQVDENGQHHDENGEYYDVQEQEETNVQTSSFHGSEASVVGSSDEDKRLTKILSMVTKSYLQASGRADNDDVCEEQAEGVDTVLISTPGDQTMSGSDRGQVANQFWNYCGETAARDDDGAYDYHEQQTGEEACVYHEETPGNESYAGSESYAGQLSATGVNESYACGSYANETGSHYESQTARRADDVQGEEEDPVAIAFNPRRMADVLMGKANGKKGKMRKALGPEGLEELRILLEKKAKGLNDAGMRNGSKKGVGKSVAGMGKGAQQGAATPVGLAKNTNYQEASSSCVSPKQPLPSISEKKILFYAEKQRAKWNDWHDQGWESHDANKDGKHWNDPIGSSWSSINDWHGRGDWDGSAGNNEWVETRVDGGNIGKSSVGRDSLGSSQSNALSSRTGKLLSNLKETTPDTRKAPGRTGKLLSNLKETTPDTRNSDDRSSVRNSGALHEPTSNDTSDRISDHGSQSDRSRSSAAKKLDYQLSTIEESGIEESFPSSKKAVHLRGEQTFAILQKRSEGAHIQQASSGSGTGNGGTDPQGSAENNDQGPGNAEPGRANSGLGSGLEGDPSSQGPNSQTPSSLYAPGSIYNVGSTIEKQVSPQLPGSVQPHSIMEHQVSQPHPGSIFERQVSLTDETSQRSAGPGSMPPSFHKDNAISPQDTMLVEQQSTVMIQNSNFNHHASIHPVEPGSARSAPGSFGAPKWAKTQSILKSTNSGDSKSSTHSNASGLNGLASGMENLGSLVEGVERQSGSNIRGSNHPQSGVDGVSTLSSTGYKGGITDAKAQVLPVPLSAPGSGSQSHSHGSPDSNPSAQTSVANEQASRNHTGYEHNYELQEGEAREETMSTTTELSVKASKGGEKKGSSLFSVGKGDKNKPGKGGAGKDAAAGGKNAAPEKDAAAEKGAVTKGAATTKGVTKKGATPGSQGPVSHGPGSQGPASQRGEPLNGVDIEALSVGIMQEPGSLEQFTTAQAQNSAFVSARGTHLEQFYSADANGRGSIKGSFKGASAKGSAPISAKGKEAGSSVASATAKGLGSGVIRSSLEATPLGTDQPQSDQGAALVKGGKVVSAFGPGFKGTGKSLLGAKGQPAQSLAKADSNASVGFLESMPPQDSSFHQFPRDSEGSTLEDARSLSPKAVSKDPPSAQIMSADAIEPETRGTSITTKDGGSAKAVGKSRGKPSEPASNSDEEPRSTIRPSNGPSTAHGFEFGGPEIAGVAKGKAGGATAGAEKGKGGLSQGKPGKGEPSIGKSGFGKGKPSSGKGEPSSGKAAPTSDEAGFGKGKGKAPAASESGSLGPAEPASLGHPGSSLDPSEIASSAHSAKGVDGGKPVAPASAEPKSFSSVAEPVDAAGPSSVVEPARVDKATTPESGMKNGPGSVTAPGGAFGSALVKSSSQLTASDMGSQIEAGHPVMLAEFLVENKSVAASANLKSSVSADFAPKSAQSSLKGGKNDGVSNNGGIISGDATLGAELGSVVSFGTRVNQQGSVVPTGGKASSELVRIVEEPGFTSAKAAKGDPSGKGKGGAMPGKGGKNVMVPLGMIPQLTVEQGLSAGISAEISAGVSADGFDSQKSADGFPGQNQSVRGKPFGIDLAPPIGANPNASFSRSNLVNPNNASNLDVAGRQGSTGGIANSNLNHASSADMRVGGTFGQVFDPPGANIELYPANLHRNFVKFEKESNYTDYTDEVLDVRGNNTKGNPRAIIINQRTRPVNETFVSLRLPDAARDENQVDQKIVDRGDFIEVEEQRNRSFRSFSMTAAPQMRFRASSVTIGHPVLPFGPNAKIVLGDVTERRKQFKPSFTFEALAEEDFGKFENGDDPEVPSVHLWQKISEQPGSGKGVSGVDASSREAQSPRGVLGAAYNAEGNHSTDEIVNVENKAYRDKLKQRSPGSPKLEDKLSTDVYGGLADMLAKKGGLDPKAQSKLELLKAKQSQDVYDTNGEWGYKAEREWWKPQFNPDYAWAVQVDWISGLWYDDGSYIDAAGICYNVHDASKGFAAVYGWDGQNLELHGDYDEWEAGVGEKGFQHWEANAHLFATNDEGFQSGQYTKLKTGDGPGGTMGAAGGVGIYGTHGVQQYTTEDGVTYGLMELTDSDGEAHQDRPQGKGAEGPGKKDLFNFDGVYGAGHTKDKINNPHKSKRYNYTSKTGNDGTQLIIGPDGAVKTHREHHPFAYAVAEAAVKNRKNGHLKGKTIEDIVAEQDLHPEIKDIIKNQVFSHILKNHSLQPAGEEEHAEIDKSQRRKSQIPTPTANFVLGSGMLRIVDQENKAARAETYNNSKGYVDSKNRIDSAGQKMFGEHIDFNSPEDMARMNRLFLNEEGQIVDGRHLFDGEDIFDVNSGQQPGDVSGEGPLEYHGGRPYFNDNDKAKDEYANKPKDPNEFRMGIDGNICQIGSKLHKAHMKHREQIRAELRGQWDAAKKVRDQTPLQRAKGGSKSTDREVNDSLSGYDWETAQTRKNRAEAQAADTELSKLFTKQMEAYHIEHKALDVFEDQEIHDMTKHISDWRNVGIFQKSRLMEQYYHDQWELAKEVNRALDLVKEGLPEKPHHDQRVSTLEAIHIINHALTLVQDSPFFKKDADYLLDRYEQCNKRLEDFPAELDTPKSTFMLDFNHLCIDLITKIQEYHLKHAQESDVQREIAHLKHLVGAILAAKDGDLFIYGGETDHGKLIPKGVNEEYRVDLQEGRKATWRIIESLRRGHEDEYDPVLRHHYHMVEMALVAFDNQLRHVLVPSEKTSKAELNRAFGDIEQKAMVGLTETQPGVLKVNVNGVDMYKSVAKVAPGTSSMKPDLNVSSRSINQSQVRSKKPHKMEMGSVGDLITVDPNAATTDEEAAEEGLGGTVKVKKNTQILSPSTAKHDQARIDPPLLPNEQLMADRAEWMAKHRFEYKKFVDGDMTYHLGMHINNLADLLREIVRYELQQVVYFADDVAQLIESNNQVWRQEVNQLKQHVTDAFGEYDNFHYLTLRKRFEMILVTYHKGTVEEVKMRLLNEMIAAEKNKQLSSIRNRIFGDHDDEEGRGSKGSKTSASGSSSMSSLEVLITEYAKAKQSSTSAQDLVPSPGGDSPATLRNHRFALKHKLKELIREEFGEDSDDDNLNEKSNNGGKIDGRLAHRGVLNHPHHLPSFAWFASQRQRV